MKTRQLLLAAFAALGMALGAHAQLKVGSNPTTTTTNTNLEVEATDGTMMVVKKDNGNVGIGTTTPSSKLYVIGNILASDTITPSDARFKENIKTLNGSLGKLMQIRGVSYTHEANFIQKRGLSKGSQIGFIAQELETIFPEFVVTGSDGYKTIDYSRLPVLVESLKEMNVKVEAQQAELNELKTTVKLLMGKK